MPYHHTLPHSCQERLSILLALDHKSRIGLALKLVQQALDTVKAASAAGGGASSSSGGSGSPKAPVLGQLTLSGRGSGRRRSSGLVGDVAACGMGSPRTCPCRGR